MKKNRSNKKQASFKESLFRLPLRHLIWVAAALLSFLPLLCLIRASLLLYLQPKLDTASMVEMIILVAFSVFSVILGLNLLLKIIERLKKLAHHSNLLHDQTMQFHKNQGTKYDPSSTSTSAFKKPIFSPEDYKNELESLDYTFNQIQKQLNRNLTQLRDHSLLVHNLKTGIEYSSEMIMVLDQANQVVFSNRKARQELGILAEREIRSALLEGNLTREDSEIWAEFLRTTWSDHESESELTTLDNNKIQVKINITIDDFFQHEKRKVIIIRDNSEHQQLERELFRSEKLAALGQLISGVAHELNNPLAAIQGFTELSLASTKDNQELNENLKVIEREVKRSSRIVENLLDFSRKQNEEKNFIDIHELLEQCIVLLAYSFRTRGIEIKRKYATDMPLVYIDEYQIQQVLMNLLINASQAMSDNIGKPEIEVSTVHDQTSNFAVIGIKDNGPGFPTELAERIFEPFFTTKGKETGTGLGLHVSQKITAKHNGWLEAENNPEGGACFKIKLPIEKPTKIGYPKNINQTNKTETQEKKTAK